MGRSHYKVVDNAYPYFHTCTVVGWLPIFTRTETVQILLDSFQYLQTHHNFTIHSYVILENHLHFISSSNDQSKHIKQFKSFTARQIIDYLKQKQVEMLLQQLSYYKARHKRQSDYQLWQEGSHPQQIQNYETMYQKVEYIHNNPVKRGYVDDPIHWRYSSARNYAGQEGLLTICKEW